jgi:hypothetical protein
VSAIGGGRVWRWAALTLLGVTLGGCGLEVQEPDLFLIRRTGEGRAVTLVINSDGTVTCNRSRTGMLSSGQLITARDIQPTLHQYAVRRLRLPPAPNSVYMYLVRVDSGPISFPDTAGATNHTLASLELLATEAQQVACGRS